VIKFTGALGGNNTVTIAPNTSPAWFIIENATTDSGSSGPYSVILTQGSGANITVANGKNAIIYCDGAGSGAVVVDAVSDLALATVTASGDVTSAGTVNVTGDTAASDGASMGYTSSEGLILTGQGSTNDVTIKNDADADVITIATGGTNVDIVGDVTASTVNADGDTAASDNAAMGYTSAEGLILTGQGSTSDVTVKNDADATVITIATGTTNVDVVGDLTAGTLNADGDTAAGDNAAIGYTSAEGLILTGQGSTNDVTIKNDADADVIKIATGGTGVEIVGALTLGTDLSVANGGTGASTFTANNVLLGNGTSAFQVIAPGSDGQVLTSTGSTWQSEAAVGGGLIFISSATASDSATLDFTGISSTYGTYIFNMENLITATDGAAFHFLTSTDGGSNYDTSGYQYTKILRYSHSTSVTGQNSASAAAIELFDSSSNASDTPINGTVKLYAPSDTATFTYIEFNVISHDGSGGANLMWAAGAGQRESAADVDAVRFKMSSGNITSGTIRMYGVVKS
jgi:hypothetical protein